MKDRAATHAIRELAERQHGVVARWQLEELEMAKTLIQGRAEAGLLVPLFQGVFALAHRRIGREGHWMAAVLASGPGAALSHGSAMTLWGLRGSRGPIEVLRRSGGVWRRRPEIRLHQTRALPPEHVTKESGIWVTTIERTLMDMAGRLDARQLEHALVAADRSGRIHWPLLHDMVKGRRGCKGIARLRRVVTQVDPRAADTKSPPEVDFLALCREFGLPLPQVNVLVEGFLVDFYWPSQRLIVETDSYGYHGDRPAFERDHKRTIVLAAAGYEVHRVTRLMLTRDPDPIVGLIRRALRRRTASNSLPARRRI